MNQRERIFSTAALFGAKSAAFALMCLAIGLPALAAPPPDEREPVEDRRPRGPRRGTPPPSEMEGEQFENDPPPRARRWRGDSRGRDRPRDEAGRRRQDGRRQRSGWADRGGEWSGWPMPEEIDRAMELIRSELPEWHERLAQIRRRQPERFKNAVRRFLPVMRDYESLRAQHPELAQTIIEEFKIEDRLRRLQHQYMVAEDDDSKRSELEEEIENNVRRQVRLRLQRRKARLEDIAKRLDREKRKYEREQAGLEALVAKRVEQIKKGKRRARRRIGESSRRPMRSPNDRRSRRGQP